MDRHGRRAPWSTVPAEIRARIETIAGSPIVAAANAVGGFSPGPAATCTLADGRSVFVKACGVGLNPVTPAFHRREAAVMASLPSGFPAPALLGVVDDGDWVALVIEHVAARMPTSPLDHHDLAVILDVVERLAELGTPAPAHGVLEPVGNAESAHGRQWAWRCVETEGLADALDPWSRAHLDALIDLESGWISAAAGSTLLHGDLRTDNVLITAAGQAVVVDWPAASIGAAWVDLVGLLPALHLDGAPPPAELFAAHPLARAADRDAVDAYLAAIAGYFTRQALLAPPPGIETLRPFQQAQGAVARAWLADRRGWR